MINLYDHKKVLGALKLLGALVVNSKRPTAEFTFQINQVSDIRRLATVIRSVALKGRITQRKIWPWSCPRTSDSIDRLCNLIMEYRRTGKHEALPPQPLPLAAGPKRSPAPRTPTRRTPDPDEDDIFEILEEYAKLPELDPSVI